MRRIRAGMTALSMIVMAVAANAEEAPPPPWSAKVAAGLILTSGNTDTDSFTGNAEVVNNRDYWRHTGTAEIYTSRTDGEKTAERWLASAKSDYLIGGGPNYLFAMLMYEDDSFSGYDYQASETVGYGRKVIERTDMTLDLEIGAGARQRKETVSGDSDNEAIVRGAAKFEWQLRESVTFGEVLTVEAGEEATISTSTTSLTSQLVGNLAAKLSFRIKHVSDVPEGVEETDTETTATLVYTF
jgi:putative salt-induced outer membrane protein